MLVPGVIGNFRARPNPLWRSRLFLSAHPGSGKNFLLRDRRARWRKRRIFPRDRRRVACTPASQKLWALPCESKHG